MTLVAPLWDASEEDDMKILRSIVGNKYLWVVLVLVIAWQGYVFLRRDPVVWSEVERQAAVAAADNFVDALEEHVPRKARFGVIHFVNDPHDLVTDTVKEQIAERDGWSVEKGSVIQKFLKDISRTMLDATSFEELIKAGKRVELDILAGGKVGDFVQVAASPDGKARCQMIIESRVYELRAGKTLFDIPVAGEVVIADVKVARGFSFWWLLAWLLVVMALPWITSFATHKALEEKSNFISSVLVTAYLVVDILLYTWLVAFFVSGIKGVLLWLVLIGGCGVYNWFACERIAEA